MAFDEASVLTNPEELDELLSYVDNASIPASILSQDWSEAQGNNRVSRCIMTFFPVDTNAKWLQPSSWFGGRLDHIQIWCGQFETCPTTDQLHAHIYVEFKNAHRPRFNTLRRVLEEISGKPGDLKVPKRQSKNQRACAVNYVLKPTDTAEGTTPFIWDKNYVDINYNPLLTNKKEKKKSKTQTTQDCIEWIESKPKHWTWDQILHESKESKSLLATCSWGVRYHAGRHAEEPRRKIQQVVVLYGAGGTGKTTLAKRWDSKEGETSFERYYKRNPDDGKFWGGGRTAYKGQRIIHLEEFSGGETAGNFKEICDIGKEGPSVNVKNSGTELNHEIVIISSNHHPAAWYRRLCENDEKQWTPICRRFTKVLFFPEKRPDGNANIPDEDNDPYIVDHTDLFLDAEFQRNYNQGVQHATDVWPLPQEAMDNVSTKRPRDPFEDYCRNGTY